MKTLRGCENGLCGRESLDRPPVGCSRDEEARECGRAPQSLMIIVSADHIVALVERPSARERRRCRRSIIRTVVGTTIVWGKFHFPYDHVTSCVSASNTTLLPLLLLCASKYARYAGVVGGCVGRIGS